MPATSTGGVQTTLTPPLGRVGVQLYTLRSLVADDMHAIVRQIPLIKSCAPGTMEGAQVVFKNQNWYTRITGTTAEYFTSRDWPLQSGAMFGEDEVRRTQKVAVLGRSVADMLFVNEEPLGQTIRIKQQPFLVVGVLAAKGQSSFGEDQDDRIFVPYTTLQKKISGENWLQFLSCTAVNRNASLAAVPQIEALLRSEKSFYLLIPTDQPMSEQARAFHDWILAEARERTA